MVSGAEVECLTGVMAGHEICGPLLRCLLGWGDWRDLKGHSRQREQHMQRS